jgi:EAL domain-containing protein (putative c-di-GMP-specific phosphodiesterase class I)/CheY-like chemotaxis protein
MRNLREQCARHESSGSRCGSQPPGADGGDISTCYRSKQARKLRQFFQSEGWQRKIVAFQRTKRSSKRVRRPVRTLPSAACVTSPSTELAFNARIRSALKLGISVPDAQFDAFYPDGARLVSSRFWTPVDVALRAAQLLVVDRATRVLDVGSGAGKFCVIGALSTGACFTGVEHRLALVDVAREQARAWQASGARFVHARFEVIRWDEFDALYFYNPFQEGVFSRSEQLDDTVELSLARFRFDVQVTRCLLASAKIGTRVVTYHGFGGTMPQGYSLLASEKRGTDRLQLWLKTSSIPAGACLHDQAKSSSDREGVIRAFLSHCAGLDTEHEKARPIDEVLTPMGHANHRVDPLLVKKELQRLAALSAGSSSATGAHPLEVHAGTPVARVVRAISKDAPSNGRSPPEARESPGRVLLVEDDLALLRASARQLTRAGYEVEAVSRAAQALHVLAEGCFEVVVSDIMMPDMDGITLLGAIRERDLELPVVLVTGTPTVDSAARALEHGALKYLAKPVPVKLLVDTVAQAVALCRQARAKRASLGDVAPAAPALPGLEAAFERALESLWIAFQPIVQVADRSLYGYEALLRSREPTFPHPGAILDAAERLGQLRHLGRTIRRKAVEALFGCSENFALFINIHPEDLLDPGLFDAESLLAGLGSRVVLEITERAALDRIEDAREQVSRARSLGFRVAVDDLGSGYAGLSTFALLEPEIVKVDMSLVRDVQDSKMKQRLIGSMATLCKEMGALIVAEGVETAEERDALVDLGCDLLQGFRFGRPADSLVRPTW